MKKPIILGFDVETDWLPSEDTTWIAQWAIATKNKTVSGYANQKKMRVVPFEILQQMQRITTSNGYESAIVAVHNLNFDFRFLLFAIEDNNLIYEITYRNSKIIAAKVYVNGVLLYFQDTALLHPGTSLADLGLLLGEPKLLGFYFSPGWSEYEKDLSYVEHDAEITQRIRQLDYDQGMTQSTASGYAWAQLKKSVNAIFHTRFKEIYPILEDDHDRLSRMCYTGGFNFSDNIGYHKGPIYHVDINSSYPHKAISKLLPYGHPIELNQMPKYGYWETILKARLELKEGCVPWYTPKRVTDLCDENNYREDNDILPIELGEGITKTYTQIWLSLNSIDWETLTENYNIFDVEWSRVWLSYKYRSNDIAQYFLKNSDEKNKLKEQLKKDPNNSTLQIKYSLAKYKLNMPTGRFGLRREGYNAIIDGDDIYTEDDEDVLDSYVPIISAICAYGRQQVIRALNTVHPSKRYHCDTDSVIAGEMPDVPIGKEFGEWELNIYDGIYEGGMKKYIEIDGDNYKVTCAGVPKRYTSTGVPKGMFVELLDDPTLIYRQVTLGHTRYKIKSPWLRELYRCNGENPNLVDTTKLLPKRVKGGVILCRSTYDLHKGTGYKLKIGHR